MEERLVKAARDGDVNALQNLLNEDPQILQKESLVNSAYSALHVAALAGRVDFVKKIASLTPSLATATNQKGLIPLHMASAQGHVETVKELLKAKLDDDDDEVNQCLIKEEDGWNPLHYAAFRGRIGVIKELMSHCPECVEQVTAKKETVLHLAMKANQLKVLQVIVESIKSLPNFQTLFRAKNINGNTAYDLAPTKKLLQVLEILKEDDEIRSEERGIDVEGEGSENNNEASKNEKSNEEWRHLQDAILIVATLIISLTYQAMANPPSTFLKEGSTRIGWSCLNNNNKGSSQGLIKRLQDCPAILALLFLIFNTLIFFQSIFIVVNTSPQLIRIPLRFLLLFLVLCYSFLLTAFYSNAVYFAFPFAFLVIFFFLFSTIHGDPEPLIIAMFRLYISRIRNCRQRTHA